MEGGVAGAKHGAYSDPEIHRPASVKRGGHTQKEKMTYLLNVFGKRVYLYVLPRERSGKRMLNFFGDIQSVSDEKLMAMAVNGNARAFSVVYDRYAAKMQWYFMRMLNKDAELARDFTQDLFVKLAERPHLFDSGKKFSAWIYTVAHNMCKNEYRKRSVRHHVPGDEYGIDRKVAGENDRDLEMNIDKNTFEKMLDIELGLLDENHRTAFLLRYKEDMSIKEIAEIMGISEGTVKSRLFYTVKKLGEKLRAFEFN